MAIKPRLMCFLVALFILFVARASAQCMSDPSKTEGSEKIQALKLKLAAIFSILIAGILGVCCPILGKKWPALQPGNNIFFLIKSFAAGVILATAFVHILPDAFEKLSNPCLSQTIWDDFPFAGFIAMSAAIGTMVIDTFATSYFKRAQCNKARPVNADEEVEGEQHQSHVDVHTHATHGHAHGSGSMFSIGEALEKEFNSSDDLIRHRIISQVLELGIVVHSVIIGISLGASENSDTIKPLVAALTFHQLFEGMGLGGCISQARFEYRVITAMVVFFSLTTPVGIVIGMVLSSFYNDNSLWALVVEGALNSASAGILIYMSLVDLIAADNVNPILLSKPKLQLGSMLSLLLGAASMSLLAKWA